MMPALDLSATGGVRGEAPASREVRRQLEKANDRVVTAEIVLTIPLGNRAASGALAAAKRGVRRVKLDEKALTVEIRRAIVEAITTMESARYRIAVLDQAVHLADQAIDAERARWEEGKSTNYDVMKRQAEREDSALRRARAQADLVEAEAALDALTGAILPRYRVGLAP
jgi:outer membrane protein TolC